MEYLKLIRVDSPDDPLVIQFARLDKQIFEATVTPFSTDDFISFLKTGAVLFGHVNINNKLVSESTILFNHTDILGTKFHSNFPLEYALLEADAVDEGYRGSGLQKELLHKRIEMAKEHDTAVLCSTIKHQNLPSIKSYLSCGFILAVDAPGFFGDGIKNDRLIYVNDLNFPNDFNKYISSNDDEIKYDDSQIDELISRNNTNFLLKVEYSDDPNENFNRQISKLIQNNYIGIGFVSSANTYAVRFIHLDILPKHIADAIKFRQTQIKNLL